MDSDILYWIWLQCCLGTDSKKLKPAIECFGSAEAMFRSGEKELRHTGIFSESELDGLVKKDLSYSERAVLKCDKLGYDVICYSGKGYPAALAEIPTPPVVLYIKGKMPDQNLPHAAIVGTRNPDETGKRLSYSFGYDISDGGGVVVSGGALGVDIFSHRGVLDAGGKTICVLGCGINKVEGKLGRYLSEEVPKNGALVTEYPPDYPPRNYTFPPRNRIISGLSDCVVTVQAGLGSGALITVKYALLQNRKIFAVPGSMDYSFSQGTNYLLKCGFQAVLCGSDVLNWIRCKNLSEEELFINPVLTKNQINILSTPPEQFDVRDDVRFAMPQVTGYETARQMSVSVLPEESFTGYVQLDFQTKDESAVLSVSQVNKENTGISSSKQSVQAENISAADKRSCQNEDDFTAESESPVYIRKGIFNMERSRFAELYGRQDDFQSLVSASDSLSDYERKHKKALNIHGKKTEREKKTSLSGVKNKSNQNEPIEHEKISKNVKNDENFDKILSEQLTAAALTVYDTISDTPVLSEMIVNITGLTTAEVLSSLTELEIYGYIKQLPGKKYVRKISRS